MKKIKKLTKRKPSAKRKLPTKSKGVVKRSIKRVTKNPEHPKDNKLTPEKILDLAMIPDVNSEYVFRYLNEVIRDKTPSIVAYGEISDAYDEGRTDHRTYVAIKKGLDLYFDRGGFIRNPARKNRRLSNSRSNPLVTHNKQAFVPANVKNWMRANVGNFEELDEYDRPIYPIRINFTRLLDESLKYFKQPGSHEYGNYPEWLSKIAFDAKLEYERKHKNDRPPVDDFDF